MIIQFKLGDDDELHTIEGEDFTLIKVALLAKYGFKNPIHLFQKELEDSLLLYAPDEGDRNNLVKRSFGGYVADNLDKITISIKTII